MFATLLSGYLAVVGAALAVGGLVLLASRMRLRWLGVPEKGRIVGHVARMKSRPGERQSYMPVVRRAWAGLSARIAPDASLVDVCAGTGAGPTLRYYYDRPAITGFDDRGGAMCLLAAVEMMELQKQP